MGVEFRFGAAQHGGRARHRRREGDARRAVLYAREIWHPPHEAGYRRRDLLVRNTADADAKRLLHEIVADVWVGRASGFGLRASGSRLQASGAFWWPKA